MKRRSRAILLLLILLLASFLRLRALGHDSLWGDEICTVWLAKMSLVDLIKGNIVYENIPPLHHLIVHFWIKLFGDSEFSVRMPSALAGIAGVWMTYVLARRLTGSRVALAAAFLMAVSPVHIA